MGARSKPAERRIHTDVLGGSLTLALGVLTLGTGIYFLVLRPPLLPEDIRRTGIEQATLPPAFLDWLGTVFHTWGAFIAGFGILLLGIGAFLLLARGVWLYTATAVGMLVAFGRFLFSNIVIRSDFLWFVSAVFTLALITAFVLVMRRGK